jgi:bacterioferritin-associated ferredoxin
MRTGIGQHCGDCRRLGAAAFAEPSQVVQRAIVTVLKQQLD